MKMNGLIGLSLIITFGLCHSVAAAEFTTKDVNLRPGEPVPVVFISGRIAPGDAVHFQDILKRKGVVFRDRQVLSLNSPGGDLREAIKLARLIRAFGFNTLVEEDASCLSACFVLYAAGFVRLGQLPADATGSTKSRVGVHRAFVDPASMRKMTPVEARRVVTEGVELSSRALREFDVPEVVIAQVQDTPAASITFLTHAQLESFSLPPWLVDLAHARCGLKVPTGASGRKEAEAYQSKFSDCSIKVLTDHRLRN